MMDWPKAEEDGAFNKKTKKKTTFDDDEVENEMAKIIEE